MRLYDLNHPNPLNEVNMSPSKLTKLSSSINALAGMEFELIIPFTPMNLSEVPKSIDHICRVFTPYANVVNVARLRSILEDSYTNYLDDLLTNKWYDSDMQVLTNYFSSVERLTGDELENAVNDAIDNRSDIYDEIRSAWMQRVATKNKLEQSWLDYHGYTDMRSVLVSNGFRPITGVGSQDFDDKIQYSFSAAVGKPVRISQSYHGAKRTVVSYIMEPDSSIVGNDGEPGLEFISPPQAVDEMISDLYKVAKWMKTVNAYTNDTTGLHINVSVPNYSIENLDYIKLVLLVGDHYVLNAFDRMANKYAASALDVIKSNIETSPASAGMLLHKMKSELNAAASKLVHAGITNKYTSVNVKTKWVEFRSPGGNWVAEVENGKIENTLRRFVVALDAAVDPEKYKNEYAKKLYKLLASSENTDTDVIQVLANYVATGNLNTSTLRSALQQSAAARTSRPAI